MMLVVIYGLVENVRVGVIVVKVISVKLRIRVDLIIAFKVSTLASHKARLAFNFL